MAVFADRVSQLRRSDGPVRVGSRVDMAEIEAARLAAGAIGPAVSRANGPVDARPPRTEPGPAAMESARQVTESGGVSLGSGIRRFFEPRFQRDFSQVRVHTGAAASAAADGLNANAFALRTNLVFGPGKYAPDTPWGARLLAHELAHVVQHDARAPPMVRRDSKYPWEQAQKRRELDPTRIPKGLNYELQDHRLFAHTTSTADIDSVVAMLDLLALYAKVELDVATITAGLTKQRAGKSDGDLVSIDVTALLPAAIQAFLKNMEEYYAAYRAYVTKHGTPEDIFKKPETPERAEELQKYYREGPKQPDEFGAACHQFAMVGTSATEKGVDPGHGPPDPFKTDMDPLLKSYLDSIHGKGPWRLVPPGQVKVGDVAVFRAGVEVGPMLPTRIVHSAIVIRVSGKAVELLEKTDPLKPSATRTVAEVLAKYAAKKTTVHFLAPALKGLPFQAGPRIGESPPGGGFTKEPGTRRPESTYVLFHMNSNVLRAHEDTKLFRVIAKQRIAAPVRVHGYASVEGPDEYNLNLSAHRAVSIKDGLTPALPSGSAVEAVAHGETGAFGEPDQNRRAGIELPTAGSAAPSGGTQESSKPPEGPPASERPPSGATQPAPTSVRVGEE